MALTTKFSKLNNTNQAITSAAVAFSGAAAYSFSFSSRSNVPLTGNSGSVTNSIIAASLSNQLYAISVASSLASSSSYIVYTVPSGRNAKVLINPNLLFAQIGSISVYNSETLTAPVGSTSPATILFSISASLAGTGGSMFVSGILAEYNSQNVYQSAQYAVSINNFPVITSSFINQYRSERMTVLAAAADSSLQGGAGNTNILLTVTPPNSVGLFGAGLTSLSNLAALGYTNASSVVSPAIQSFYLGAGDSIVISYAAQASVDTLYAMEIAMSFSMIVGGGVNNLPQPILPRASISAGTSASASTWWQSRSVSYGITASQFLNVNAGLMVIEEPAS